MTPDIVERLRELYAEHEEACRVVTQGGDAPPLECALADECDQAADEITRLRERVSELEAAKRVAREGLRIADRDYQARIAHLERVQGALRKQVIRMGKKGSWIKADWTNRCLLCQTHWDLRGPEQHAQGCLAAKDDAVRKGEK